MLCFCNLIVCIQYITIINCYITLLAVHVLLTTADSNRSLSWLLSAIIVPTVLLFVIVGIILFCWKKHKSRMSGGEPLLYTTEADVLSKPVEMLNVISEGQFGDVWRALYEHEYVALKRIQPFEKSLWVTEKSVYVDCNVRHKSILKFISAEERYKEEKLQYWIITTYHERGSLADYLCNAVLTFDNLLRLTLSMVEGLTYLHTEDKMTIPMKPIIAHRDFKSRNVLVQNDLTCCISDFGLSYAFSPDSSGYDESKTQVGHDLNLLSIASV